MLYWPIAAAFSVYPVGFPLLVLPLIYKYHGSQSEHEVAFGLKVFFENYKNKFWFWEIIEMYCKLILISLIFLFGSESISQIGATVFTVSAFGVAYPFFRPRKGKFEDRLQTFVLWVIFFDVTLEQCTPPVASLKVRKETIRYLLTLSSWFSAVQCWWLFWVSSASINITISDPFLI